MFSRYDLMTVPRRSVDMIEGILHDVDELFDRSCCNGGVTKGFNVDVRETVMAFVITADLPGITKEDVNVTIENGVLTISGERVDACKDEGANYRVCERSPVGPFSRTFKVPREIEANSVKASMADGVLKVTLKRKPEAQPQRIAIQ